MEKCCYCGDCDDGAAHYGSELSSQERTDANNACMDALMALMKNDHSHLDQLSNTMKKCEAAPSCESTNLTIKY